MADHDDARRLLRLVAEDGGPPGIVNVAGRGAEIDVDDEAMAGLVGRLSDQGLVEILDDGDLRLTALGRALLESPDS